MSSGQPFAASILSMLKAKDVTVSAESETAKRSYGFATAAAFD